MSSAYTTRLSRASLITAVPGGVGPTTIAVLLTQTVDAAAQQAGLNPDSLAPPQ
jgi:methylenetetrahydrofolate dehydrogenase (NADP+) / methenyltetrahydrofolate cyclohydrolase